MNRKLLVAFGALVFSGAAIAGPSDNSLVLGTTQQPAQLDPFVNNQAISAEVNSWLFAGLTYFDFAGNLQADLAAEVPTERNGGVKLTKNAAGDVTAQTIRWNIKPNLKWSDGRPITAEDFRFAHEVFGDERLPVASRDNFPKSFKVLDPTTFELTYDPPYLFATAAPSFVQNYVPPAHIIKPIWERTKGLLAGKTKEQQIEIIQKEFLAAPFFTSRQGPIVTSGPFKFSRWTRDQSWTLSRNANYWNNNPTGVDRIVYRFFAKTDTLQVNVLAGQVDATSSVGLVASATTVQTLKAASRNVYNVYTPKAALWEHLDVNQFDEKVQEVADLQLQDKRTRQALIYALDRETSAKDLRGGTAVVSNNFVNSVASVYTTQGLTNYGYNPERSKQILAALGWKAGSDGILERSVGGRTVKFVLEYVTTAGNTVRERDQQLYKDNLKKVGIDVKFNNAPSSVVFDDAFIAQASAGKWKGIFQFAYVQAPLTEDLSLYYCEDKSSKTIKDNVPTADNGFAGQNIGGWCNPKYDDLWDKARREFNLDERKKLLAEAQKVWNDELPAIPLYERTDLYTARQGLRNYTWNAATRYPSALGWQIGWSQKGQKEIVPMK
ncbi:MAG: peptide ABC transporter substrate-binding protein [Pleurocapsa sp. SU_196_0]|nr:peptide ABC transporter substrate-binding protein [Pleurocapsa sp. SU_196_0]